MEFGFLLDPTRISVDGIEVCPCADFASLKESFYETAAVSEGWILPPIITAKLNDTEKKRFRHHAPQAPAAFIELPHTHIIRVSPASEEKSNFLVLAYGFLLGVYVSPSGHLFLARIPYQQGHLTGVVPRGDDYGKGLVAFSQFYDRSTPEQRRQMFAVLHWFLVGQTYQFEWDRFDAQYKVLDALFKLSGLRSPNHASRPIAMAEKYGLQLPHWAELLPARSNSSKLSTMRNDLVHEAIYASHPIGYSYPEENFDIELVAFNVRLIAAVIGLKTPVLTASPSDRAYHTWDLT